MVKDLKKRNVAALAVLAWLVAARFVPLPVPVKTAVTIVVGIYVFYQFVRTTTGPWRSVALASAFAVLGLSAFDFDLLSRPARQLVGATVIGMFFVMIVAMWKAPRRAQIAD